MQKIDHELDVVVNSGQVPDANINKIKFIPYQRSMVGAVEYSSQGRLSMPMNLNPFTGRYE